MGFERGTVIAGKYCVERILGEGGMGVVFAARHLGLDEMVAVKLIRDDLAAGEQILARFQREARAVARIKSEHVARVLDVDRLPGTDGRPGAPYIVMELMDGTDLDALLERGPITAGDAATYISQACEGLAEAHALGMVHRDLKLTNLFLTHRRDGRPLIKVIDFGVVKLTTVTEDLARTQPLGALPSLGRAAEMLTGTSVMIGSIHYMAPEQIRASNVVDARADVWSLGVCLYRMLTGTLPFDGQTMISVVAAIQVGPIVDVRTHAPGVPPELAAAVMRALERDVDRRFANVGELARALAPFAADPAGAARVETILRSAPATRPPLATEPPPPPAANRVDGAPAATAFGTIVGVPMNRPSRSFVTGAILVLVAAALVVASSLHFRSQASLAAATPAPSSTPIVTASVPAPEMPRAAVSTVPPVVVAPVAPVASAPTPIASALRPPKTRRPPPPPPTTTKKPSTEPPNAYDSF